MSTNTATPIKLTILGIETSCDETAASIVEWRAIQEGDDFHNISGKILSNIVRTQLKEHEAFGGVVPEIAARAHVDNLDKLIKAALSDADKNFHDLNGISATTGPGLIGGLLVGMMTAKAIAATHKLPFIAVNHLAGHALTVGLTDNTRPPYLLLLVSGGHTQLLWVEDVGQYTRIGSTIDDALGEAFDKTAKLLGLGFPGGPSVEQWAQKGDENRFKLPTPLKGRPEPNFSFSGLKTALRQQAQKLEPISDQDIADLCASFQKALTDTVIDRLLCGLKTIEHKFEQGAPRNFVISGGVAANKYLRSQLKQVASDNNLTLILPPLELCTDNAVMIAWAGAEQLARGKTNTMETSARSRWPLDENATPVLGSGKAGAKA